jgi:hypothetical protein
MGARGFMYASGLLWGDQIRPSIASEVDGDGSERAVDYRLTAVNVPVETTTPKPPVRRIEFTCGAKLQRLLVDSEGTGKLRLRAWERPRSVSDKPDFEIAGGEAGVEGTASCASSQLDFPHSETTAIRAAPAELPRRARRRARDPGSHTRRRDRGVVVLLATAVSPS